MKAVRVFMMVAFLFGLCGSAAAQSTEALNAYERQLQESSGALEQAMKEQTLLMVFLVEGDFSTPESQDALLLALEQYGASSQRAYKTRTALANQVAASASATDSKGQRYIQTTFDAYEERFATFLVEREQLVSAVQGLKQARGAHSETPIKDSLKLDFPQDSSTPIKDSLKLDAP